MNPNEQHRVDNRTLRFPCAIQQVLCRKVPLFRVLCLLLFATALPFVQSRNATSAEVVGVTVTPHSIADSMRYRRPRDPSLAARVQLFIKGSAMPGQFDGKTPAELLADGQWTWHDMQAAVESPEDALTVWTFNGKSNRWGGGHSFRLEADGLKTREITIDEPRHYVSATTFLADDGGVYPDTAILYIANDSAAPLRVNSCRLWLPNDGKTWQTLYPQPAMPAKTNVAAHDKGFIRLKTDRLPLTYAALELDTDAGSIWCHLRIKREDFDISGGWVAGNATHEAYLKLLKHLHIDTGHFGGVRGYTDNAQLYERYPMKLFNRLWPLDQWDTDAWLPKIHAVEFLGEPQYGGGRPVPPQEVFDKLLPYRTSRLATSVTHSEERIWRWYAGLSDYPHYDAYRVVAPAADSWSRYDRWNGRSIRWGAPLETIGDMCRSLRELNRPMPCAYWSQGPHDGWRGGWDGRSRRSPTLDELRAQALHALSTRITSLYWFNLSLKSLMKFPDTWEAITRVGREIRMLEPFYLQGDAYDFQRKKRAGGSPDWDLATIAAPDAAVLFALDTAYTADEDQHQFTFGKPRDAQFRFTLPPWLRRPVDLFRVDADGVHPAKWQVERDGVVIHDTRSRDAIYVAALSSDVRTGIEARRRDALNDETTHPIDRPALDALMEQQ